MRIRKNKCDKLSNIVCKFIGLDALNKKRAYMISRFQEKLKTHCKDFQVDGRESDGKKITSVQLFQSRSALITNAAHSFNIKSDLYVVDNSSQSFRSGRVIQVGIEFGLDLGLILIKTSGLFRVGTTLAKSCCASLYLFYSK